MRRGQGWLTTLIMLVPMTAVPMMAVFGIPQFAPVSASPTPVERELEAFNFREHRVGHSDAYPMPRLDLVETGDRADDSDGLASDLFAPLDGQTTNATAAAETRTRESGHAWSDPLAYSSLSLEQQRSTSSLPASAADDRRAMPDAFSSRSFQNRQSGATSLLRTSFGTGHDNLTGRAAIDDMTARHHAADSGDFPKAPSVDVRDRRTEPSRNQFNTPSPGMPSPGTRSMSADLTWATAIDELNAEGVHNYRLTPGAQPGTFRFMCFVTSVEDPRVSRRFEAEAGDPLGAVGQVLVQVVDWNRAQ